MCNEKSMFESSDIDLFDRKHSQRRRCSGSIANLQAVDMGSIPVRCRNSYGKVKEYLISGKD